MTDLEKLKAKIIDAIFAEMALHPDQHDIRQFIDQPAYALDGYHSTLGRDIRNNYDLWGHPVLSAAFVHPDEFSMEIIKELHTKAISHFRRSLFTIK